MGPYYFTALAALLGPVKRIGAFSATGFSQRKIYTGPRAWKMLSVETPTHYSGAAVLSSGVIVSLNFSFDIWHSNLPKLEIYGTEGALEVPDPNLSGGKPKVYRKEQRLEENPGDSVEVPQLYPNLGTYTRGSGVLDLARAAAEGGKPRVSAEMALHVVEAITGMMESARTGKIYEMKTSCERPLPLHME